MCTRGFYPGTLLFNLLTKLRRWLFWFCFMIMNKLVWRVPIVRVPPLKLQSTVYLTFQTLSKWQHFRRFLAQNKRLEQNHNIHFCRYFDEEGRWGAGIPEVDYDNVFAKLLHYCVKRFVDNWENFLYKPLPCETGTGGACNSISAFCFIMFVVSMQSPLMFLLDSLVPLWSVRPLTKFLNIWWRKQMCCMPLQQCWNFINIT